LENIGKNTDFFELGGDSLKATTLIFMIEDQFDFEMNPDLLIEQPTIAKLATMLKARAGISSDVSSGEKSVTTYKSGAGLKKKIVFFPDALGTSSSLRNISALIAGDVEIFGLQSEPVKLQNPSAPSIGEMVAGYIDKIPGLAPDDRLIVGGWSFGGLLAYEAVRQLQENGYRVEMLVMIDTEKPQKEFWERTADSIARRLRNAFPEISSSGRADLVERADLESSLFIIGRSDPTAENLDVLLSCLPEEVTQAIPGWREMPPEQLFISAYKIVSCISALADYDPPKNLNVNLNFYEAKLNRGENSAHAWAGLVAGEVRQKSIPGDHHSILQKSYAGEIAAHFNRAIADLNEAEN
jgi:thioesterase domain-containing protein/acyl carrier protein